MSDELMNVMKKLKKEAGGEFHFGPPNQTITVEHLDVHTQNYNPNLLYPPPMNRPAFEGQTNSQGR